MTTNEKKDFRDTLNNINREIALDKARLEIRKALYEVKMAEYRKLDKEISQIQNDQAAIMSLIKTNSERIREIEEKLVDPK